MIEPAPGQPRLIVVSRLKAAGLSDSEITEQIRHAQRIRRGVYCEAWPDTVEEQHLLRARAVLATHEGGAFLSHASAALAHGLPLWRARLADVHVMGATHGKNRRGIKYHDPAGRPVLTATGMPATSVAQTVWDCARSDPFDSAVVLGDAALHRDLTTPSELAALMDRWRRKHGVARGSRVLAALDGASESPGETRCRLLLVELGYRVESQFHLDLEDRHYRADFRIVGTAVLVEFDGRTKYRSAPEETVWREKVRADHIANLGFEIVRLTWDDLDRPAHVDQMIRRAMARRG